MTSPVDKTGASDDQEVSSRVEDATAGALGGLFGRDSLFMMLWAVQLVAAALVTPVMTRLLDAPNFGEVTAANAVMQVLFVLAGFGLHQAIQKQYAEGGPVEPAKILTAAIVGALALTILLDLTGPVWAEWVGFSGYTDPVRIAVLWAGTSAVTNTAIALLRSQDRLLAFSTVSLLQSVVAEVTSLVLVVVLEATATVFLLGQLILQVIATVVALFLVRPAMPRARDRAMLKRALAFGLPLVPAALCTFLLNTSDRLIIQSELGSAEVGRYQVAYNVGALPMLMLGLLNLNWMPRIFALREADERDAVISASRDLLYMLLIPAVIGLAVGAPLILRIWAPPEYRPDTLQLVNALVLVSAIPYAAGLAATRSLMAVGSTTYIAIAQAAAAAANVGLNLLLIPRWGLEGSAVSTLIALSVLHLMLLARANSLVSVRGPRAGLLVALTATAGITIAIAWVPFDSVTLLRVALVLVTIAWFAYVFFTLAKPPSEGPAKQGLQRYLPRRSPKGDSNE